jgi:lipoprotein NlpI
MRIRILFPLAAAIGATIFFSQAQAAVSVLGGGAAETCYQGADTGGSPFDFLSYCDQALAGELTDHDRAATYVNRGVLRLALGENRPASMDFTTGLGINAQMGEGWVDLGATQITDKRFADAIANIDKGLKLGVKQPHLAYYDRAMAQEALGNLQAAYDDYRQALTIAPDFVLASNELKRFKIVDKPNGA